MEFRGSMVAMITPFTEDGKIDKTGVEKLINFHIENGTDAILLVGTTGESATLTHDEHKELIKMGVEISAGRIPIVAGTGSNSTAEAIELTKFAKETGADAALLITPYYNKPTQKGMYLHFKKIAESADIPIVLYNVPSRTGINLLPDTVARLSEIPNIVAVKEASGNLGQMVQIISKVKDGFNLMSGDDQLLLPILSIGGTGVISVVANIIPKDMSQMIKEWEAGNIDKAREMYYKMYPLAQAMFYETNPIPVKTAARLLGLPTGELRLPLAPMDDINLEKLKKAMKNYGLEVS